MFAKVKSVVSKQPQTETDATEVIIVDKQPITIGKSNQIQSTHCQRIGMVVDMADTNLIGSFIPVIETPRFPYSRPEFLYFSEEEINVSADQITRPVLVPKDPTRMPAYAGYAEVINAGKSEKNEDQASARLLSLVQLGYEACEAVDMTETNVDRNSSKLIYNQVLKSGRHRAVSSECRQLNNDDITVSSDVGSFGHRRHSDDELLAVAAIRGFSIEDGPVIPRAEAVYFAIFDGHAGTGAAIMAANCLHEHVRDRLSQVLETIIHLDRQEQLLCGGSSMTNAISATSSQLGTGKMLTCDSLVVGALETAFVDMDEQISEEKLLWRITGGAAACIALFFLGKLYIANCGDCRAVLVAGDRVEPLSIDFTPTNERKRLQHLAYRQPELIGNSFTRFEYSRHLTRKDLKRKVLYRDWYMDGWAVKTVRDSDLKPPLIGDTMRKRRLLNTIGVTRGFGDHHLMTVDDKIPIKPFLSPVPEVRIFNVQRELDRLTDRDVLILASDGLWDVLTNDDAAMIVRSTLDAATDDDERSKYTLAAQDLVIAARGDRTESGRWQLASSGGGAASSDDIAVFVIPLKYAIAPPVTDDDDDVELLK